jgi:predicted dehydrogenase
MNSAIVVGHGSIGRRHAEILHGLGLDVRIVSRRQIAGARNCSSIGDAVRAAPEAYAVIADETSRHDETLNALLAAGHAGPVLVEKPLFAASDAACHVSRENIFVGYDLRFYDLVAAMRQRLAGRTVYTAEVVVGQYLPDWRPGRDYREVYSARRAEGGGVLRDLSHEIDLLLWLLGPWRRVAALVGRSGALDIDSEDYAHVLIEGADYKAATLGLDYLDRNVRRSVTVQHDGGTLALDMIAGRLIENGDLVAESRPDWNDVYRLQHQAVLAGGNAALCTMEQGLAAIHAVEAIERAAETGLWQTF